MILNQISGGGSGAKKATINPAGTSVSYSSNYPPKYTFTGLTPNNVKSGCIAATLEGNGAYGLLFISKSGETYFAQSGSYNFSVAQAYDPANGTFVMQSNTIYSGHDSFIIVLE